MTKRRKADLMYLKKSEYSAMQKELENLRMQSEVNDIWTEIKKIDPHPGEYVIVKFKYGRVKWDSLQFLMNNCRKRFPNNKVIAIADDIDMQVWDADRLNKFIRKLREDAISNGSFDD